MDLIECRRVRAWKERVRQHQDWKDLLEGLRVGLPDSFEDRTCRKDSGSDYQTASRIMRWIWWGLGRPRHGRTWAWEDLGLTGPELGRAWAWEGLAGLGSGSAATTCLLAFARYVLIEIRVPFE